jgi:hypothetical protein
MAKRRSPGRKRPRQPDDRPLSLGSHWRDDGLPKTPYASQSDAWAMADERRQDTGVVLNVYRCDFCASWHLGRGDGRPGGPARDD